LAPYRDAFPANAPVVSFHLVDDHHRGGWVFVQHTRQQVGDALDEFGLLFRSGTFTGDLDVYVRHEALSRAACRRAASLFFRGIFLMRSSRRRAVLLSGHGQLTIKDTGPRDRVYLAPVPLLWAWTRRSTSVLMPQ
jgi:hypothetical protein